MLTARLRPSFALGCLSAITLGLLLCISGQVVTKVHIRSAAADTISTSGPLSICVTADEQQPAALNITTDGGLQLQIDRPLHYQVYGTTADELRQQIKQCGPKAEAQSAAEFTAETNYQMNWRYNYSVTNGVCQITQASVGLHVNQIMPLWQAPPSAQTGLVQAWQSFTKNLATHENGHIALDVQYAHKLQTDLKNFPATPCSHLVQSVKQLTDSDMSRLQQANDNYDTTTNHGTTQGAVLPR